MNLLSGHLQALEAEATHVIRDRVAKVRGDF